MDKTLCVPTAALLNAWSDEQWTKGIQISNELAELETLVVRTQNNVYEITALCRAHGRGACPWRPILPRVDARSHPGGQHIRRFITKEWRHLSRDENGVRSAARGKDR